MKSYFTVTVRYFTGKKEVYNHVPASSLSYGTHPGVCEFIDDMGNRHIIIGATITIDEETSYNAEFALPSDTL